VTGRDAPPFKHGDPRARELGKLGGRVTAEARRAKAAADPTTRGLLGELLTYSTSDWMDRFDLTQRSWDAWRAVGRVLDGLPLTADEMTLYRQLTGRTTTPPSGDLRECWLICGRGSGKTSFLTVQAIKSAFRGYPVRGLVRVLFLSLVLDQASLPFEFFKEFVDGDRELAKLVIERTKTSLRLAHGVEVRTIRSSYRQVRGYTVACALADELAHWYDADTNSNPATEVIRSLRPALGKCPGSRLLVATSPWVESGIVYDTFTKYWGKEPGDVAA